MALDRESHPVISSFTSFFFFFRRFYCEIIDCCDQGSLVWARVCVFTKTTIDDGYTSVSVYC